MSTHIENNMSSRSQLEEIVMGAILAKGRKMADIVCRYLTINDIATPDLKEYYKYIVARYLRNESISRKAIYHDIREKYYPVRHELMFSGTMKSFGELSRSVHARFRQVVYAYEDTLNTVDIEQLCKLMKEDGDKIRAFLIAQGEMKVTQGKRKISRRKAWQQFLDAAPLCFSGTTMRRGKLPEETSLVAGLIQKQSVNFLYGAEGCGKSLLAMNLGMSVAAGLYRFLSYDIKQEGPVIYLNNELPLREFQARFITMTKALQPPQRARLKKFLVPKILLPIELAWDDLNCLCRKYKPALIVVDCFYWAHNKPENDSTSMKAIMQKLSSISTAYNLAILVVHHTKKGSNTRVLETDNMRGSGVFGAATDSDIELRRSGTNPSQRILKPTKLRYGSDILRKTHLLSLDEKTLWFHDEGIVEEEDHIRKNRTHSTIDIDLTKIIHEGEIVTRGEVIERCKQYNYYVRTIDRVLNKAKEAGMIISPKHGEYSLP